MSEELFTTIKELEEYMEACDATVQITCRVLYSPTYLVRIKRKSTSKGSTIYRQAVGDSISEAFEACLEAWTKDEEAPQPGRKSTTEVKD